MHRKNSEYWKAIAQQATKWSEGGPLQAVNKCSPGNVLRTIVRVELKFYLNCIKTPSEDYYY